MKHIFSILLLLFVTLAQAQITERTNDNTIYKLGNRPEKGTKVLTIGLNLNDTTFSTFELGNQGVFIMGRYFISERTAIRASVRYTKDLNVSRGLEIDTTISGTSQVVHDLRKSRREYALMPGIERHFKYNNLFDIYFGGDAILGLNRMVNDSNKEYSSNIYTKERRRTPETLLGLGGLVGMNFFISDLPLSIGIEYQLTGLWRLGNKTHVVRETRDASGVVTTDDYYTQEKDAWDNPDPFAYTKLKKRAFETMDCFRLTLNFYIK